MKHKKYILISLLLFILSLCGCTQEHSIELPKIGVCFQDRQNSIYPSGQQSLLSTLESAGFQVTAADGKNDQTKQVRQITDFLDQSYDLLIIEPVMASASGDLLAQLQAADTPAVFINREPESDVLEQWNRVCYVGCDAMQPGLLQGRIICNTLNQGDFNGDGIVSYGIISGPQDHIDAQLRAQYCAKELTFGALETALLTTGYGDWTIESGQRICAQMLSQYGKDLEVIFCGNDAMALGAIQAIEDGGRVVGENLYLIGVDAIKEAVQMVQDGKLTGTVCIDYQHQLEQITQAVQALLSAQSVESRYYTDCQPITAESNS